MDLKLQRAAAGPDVYHLDDAGYCIPPELSPTVIDERSAKVAE